MLLSLLWHIWALLVRLLPTVHGAWLLLGGLPLVGLASSSNGLMDLLDDPQLVQLAGATYIAKFFQYVANFAFTTTGTLQANITIDSDADFQLIWLIGSYDQSAVTVNIQEGGAGGLAWMNQPVNIANFLGTAQLPFPIGLIPQLLPKKRVYTFSLVNSYAGANNVQICFTGYKLFPAQMAAQVGAVPSTN